MSLSLETYLDSIQYRKMTESKYKIIQINQNVHTDQEDDGDDDDDDTVTIVPANETDDLHFSNNKFTENNIMQTPTAILSLILIYFTLSIGLTFYQRNLLKVVISIELNDSFFVF